MPCETQKTEWLTAQQALEASLDTRDVLAVKQADAKEVFDVAKSRWEQVTMEFEESKKVVTTNAGEADAAYDAYIQCILS